VTILVRAGQTDRRRRIVLLLELANLKSVPILRPHINACKTQRVGTSSPNIGDDPFITVIIHNFEKKKNPHAHCSRHVTIARTGQTQYNIIILLYSVIM